MNTLVVLFNLRPDADVAAYEAWARSTDLPVVRALPAVRDFSLYRSQGLFGSGEAGPFQYVEVIDIADLTEFGAQLDSATMRRVADEFRQFADNPVFLLTERIS